MMHLSKIKKMELFSIRILLILSLVSFLMACVSVHRRPPDLMAHLASGRHAFQTGYFKAAMHILLPLACDGVPEAQYAVGYMHYYGYGVIEDKQIGFIWIDHAARAGFPPAVEAIKMIKINGD